MDEANLNSLPEQAFLQELCHFVFVIIHIILLTQYSYKVHCNLLNTGCMEPTSLLLAALPAAQLIYM